MLDEEIIKYVYYLPVGGTIKV